MNSSNNNELGQNDTTTSTEKKCAKSACCGIYGLRNKITGKWYVGQSVNILERWKSYDSVGCKSQRKLSLSFAKHGVANFEKVILEECDVSLLNSREDHWMGVYNSIEKGYNIRKAGSKGHHSEETKRLISISSTGKKKSPEHISKLPQNQKGKKQRPELVERRAASLRGTRWSDERKQRYKIIMMSKKRPKRTREEINFSRRELYRKSREGIIPHASLRNKPRSEETRKKISDARRKAEALRKQLRQVLEASPDQRTL